jgi:hypothetical protein
MDAKGMGWKSLLNHDEILPNNLAHLCSTQEWVIKTTASWEELTSKAFQIAMSILKNPLLSFG